jgi:endonuclease YncB( thermonuclease family)
MTAFASWKRGAASVLLLLALTTQAETIKGRVVAVADGDTVTVLDATKTQYKVRLAGIDAPEKAQAFGQRSKESLGELVFDRVVTVETTKRDRYGRSVGTVRIDGLDANLEQIKRGMAWHYRAYEREQSPQERQDYAAAEVAAREARLGLWKDAQPVPPWDFRYTRKESQSQRM